ncbi:ABC transporter ATP-binding protein [Paucidesulfovibrio longus]|uniref:ABC transporter ATP-binding protein n=1 Tax=Paucidesulfovibrio longus TaxID=889 RepID=UPI0003B31828|nr:ABC transporter ATP-binding protein [Paucidesulfovibrio longus]
MIVLENLDVELPGFALRGVSLSVAEREFFALLGPTGAGKSVLLETVAGLLPVRRGRVRLDGRDITRLPPERRGLGMVYQDNALFPHLSVRRNIAFGLRHHRGARPERVGELAELLGIAHLLPRSLHGLSGGERQRVALARALAVEPRVLLLDEPLSALDPNSRHGVKRMLKDLHRETGITFMMVTHDFDEALFLADRAAVIRGGRVVQQGAVQDIFHRPADAGVAEFVGMRNVLAARMEGRRACVGRLKLDLPAEAEPGSSRVAFRPEDAVLGGEELAGRYANCFPVTISSLVPEGFQVSLEVRAGDLELSCCVTRRRCLELEFRPGSRAWLALPEAALHVF